MRSDDAEQGPHGRATSVGSLPAKFRRPLLPPDLVPRRRLVERLSHGTQHALTLVSAPAGYGKTVLAGTWAERAGTGADVLHTTMDEADTVPAGFWRTALRGLGDAGVDVSGLRPGTAPQARQVSVTRLARRIAARGTPLVWVLDCDEFSLPPAVGEALHALLVECPSRLRLVLLTRTDPPIPLHRHRLAGSITEIRAHDLAFTDPEVSALVQHTGLDLPPDDVGVLRNRTDGWPTGVRFAAMSLAGAEDPHRAVQEFRGDTGNVAAYLVDEVLAKQVPETRSFLLRTSVATVLEPGLVEVLTGQHCDARTLEFAARGNSFVEAVPGDPGCYRYSSLFREFLRSQLAYEHPDLLPELHLAAAGWLARNGRPLEAVRHAVSAGDWSAAAHHVIEDVGLGRLLLCGERTGLTELLGAMPADVDGLAAGVVRAATALAGLDVGRATAELGRARELAQAAGTSPGPSWGPTLLVLQALADSLGPEREDALVSALAAEDALRLETTHDLRRHADLRVVVAASKARVLVRRGELDVALAALRAGLETAEQQDLEPAAHELRGLAALTEAMQGHLQAAEEAATLPVPETGSQAATLALAWVRIDQHDLPTAEALLDRAESLTSSYDATVLGPVHALLRARLHRAQGHRQLALAGLRAALATIPEAGPRALLRHRLVVEESVSLLGEALPEDAATAMEGVRGCRHLACAAQRCRLSPDDAELDSVLAGLLADPSAAQAPLEAQVQAWLARASAALRAEDPAGAERHLERALQLAIPERLRRPFHESPAEVKLLLERSGQWQRLSHDHPAPHLPAQRVASSVGGGHRADRMPLVVPLTKREQEVLGHLADLLTTDEIAQEMFVSVNTVRSHIRSIFRKLGVARRNEAVRRAWELELLPPRTAA